MPDCIGDEKLLKKPLEKNQKLIQNTDRKIEVAAQNINENTPPTDGLSIFAHLAGLLGQRLWFYNKTINYKIKPNIDSNRCVACGKCVQLCPMKNLSLIDDKIVFKGKCTMCYRCVNFCPKQTLTILGKKVHEQCYFEKYNI